MAAFKSNSALAELTLGQSQLIQVQLVRVQLYCHQLSKDKYLKTDFWFLLLPQLPRLSICLIIEPAHYITGGDMATLSFLNISGMPCNFWVPFSISAIQSPLGSRHLYQLRTERIDAIFHKLNVTLFVCVGMSRDYYHHYKNDRNQVINGPITI